MDSAGIVLLVIGLVVILTVVFFLLAIWYSVRLHSLKTKHVDAAVLKALKVPQDSLFSLLQKDIIPMEKIAAKGYASVLAIVNTLIGVQPTCDMVLEIWPPAFESYNIIVPNFLNLPYMLLFGAGEGTKSCASKDLICLAAYASSRANNCAYCTSHCCSFAARRGVHPEILRNLLVEVERGTRRGVEHALEPDRSESVITDTQRAVVTLAYGLGSVPCSLSPEHIEEVETKLSDAHIEWIVAAAAMFGSFNKLMDGLNIPLEADTYAETIGMVDAEYSLNKADNALIKANEAKDGWKGPPPDKDNWTTKLAIIYQGIRPGGALALDMRLLKGIPSTANGCMSLLKKTIGCTFSSVLTNLTHERFMRGVTAVIIRNFSSSKNTDELGIRRKVQAGIQFCDVLENDTLRKELEVVAVAAETGGDVGNPEDDDAFHDLFMAAAKAFSYAPTRTHPSLIQQMRDSKEFTSARIVELMSFMATVQMLHRIVSFYDVKKSTM